MLKLSDVITTFSTTAGAFVVPMVSENLLTGKTAFIL